METVVVYSAYSNNRLSYVLDWLLKERLQLTYSITDNEAEAQQATNCICYGKQLDNKISIPDASLLQYNTVNALHTTDAAIHEGKGLQKVTPVMGVWENLPVLFAQNEQGYTLPFDLLSAIFYLLSRYEEYLCTDYDKHGRFPATASILYKEGLLTRPIVDEWIEAFRQLLIKVWDTPIQQHPFTFQPSYDIDMAYSHAYKGIGRIAGAYIRALLKGDVAQINERTQVLKKKVTDPYDSFAWLRHQHEQYGYKPLYFILCALRTTAFDKNIHPKHPAMIRVIKQLAKEGNIAIHPSYYATHYDVLAKEKNVLKNLTGQTINLSRQHYIRLMIPVTYQLLMDNEIHEDYSMGYGTHTGFRAGTGSSFLWYDLLQERVAPIRTHPFCFMDTTAHYELGLTPEQSFFELRKMERILKHTGSTMITVFHNFSLGTDKEWDGWNTAYQSFLAEMSNRHSA